MSSFPREKGIYQVMIHDWAEEGETLARLRGVPIYIPHAIPGEKVRICVSEVFKSYSRARIESVLEPSTHRQEASCEYFPTCGGCQWQHVDSQTQLEAKRFLIERNFSLYESLKGTCIAPVIASPALYAYRNKFQVPVAEAQGRTVGGFYYPRSHELTPLDHCQVQSDKINQIYREILRLIASFKIEPYDEIRHRGLLRTVVIREGFHTGEVMIIFVTKSDLFPNKDMMIENLIDKFPSIVSIVHNIQPEKTNVILGPQSAAIFGNLFFHEKVLNWTFRISSSSFFQINSHQIPLFIEVVRRLSGFKPQDRLLDLYCGVGLFSIAFSSCVSEILGIDFSSQAIDDAQSNALENGASNVEFTASPVDQALAEVASKCYNAVILDPPRQGLQKNVIRNLVALKIPRIIYVSCDPESLARDLDALVGNGYQIEEVQPMDLFPQTYHVETIVRLVPNPAIAGFEIANSP